MNIDINFDSDNSCVIKCNFNDINCKFLKFQRDINKDKLQDIIKSYENDLINKNKINNMGVIILGNIENNYYIIDGQHRYNSLFFMYEKYNYTCKVYFLIYKCKDENEIFDYFSKINKNELVYDWNKNNIDHIMIFKNSYYFIEKKYQSFITNKQSKIPKININNFFDILEKNKILITNNINSSEKLINFLENINNIVLNSINKYKYKPKITERLKYFEKKEDEIKLYLSFISLKNWNFIFESKIKIDENIIDII